MVNCDVLSDGDFVAAYINKKLGKRDTIKFYDAMRKTVKESEDSLKIHEDRQQISTEFKNILEQSLRENSESGLFLLDLNLDSGSTIIFQNIYTKKIYKISTGLEKQILLEEVQFDSSYNEFEVSSYENQYPLTEEANIKLRKLVEYIADYGFAKIRILIVV
jgi:hypothetical protein